MSLYFKKHSFGKLNNNYNAARLTVCREVN